MPRCWRAGPFSMRAGVAQQVVVLSATRLKRGSHTASTAASTAGKTSGTHPARTALTAIFSTVASPRRGSTTPTTCDGGSGVASSIAWTRVSVGGITGKPSPQPCASTNAKTAAGSSSTLRRSEVSVPRAISDVVGQETEDVAEARAGDRADLDLGPRFHRVRQDVDAERAEPLRGGGRPREVLEDFGHHHHGRDP